MTTAGVDPDLANNIQLLQEQSLKVQFHLDHTDYKKVENIGTGAYGVVCSAINKKTRQRVAIKKIPNLFTMDPRYAIRTYREIKILQHFKHSNIIAIREILQPVDKDITDIYVVMDLMESDLHRIIYSKQTLTDDHVQYFLYQILRGLKYIHSAHVIHRDLKPSNLLVNADCELKIGDFGMARGINFRAEKSNQQMTQYVATRWYRAPELIVAVRQGYGAAIDMWSVGCIFAEMLRRKHLFPGRDLLNQLAVIFGTLGVPSKQYLELLDSDTVCGFIKKVTEAEGFKPKTYLELCPKADPDAVDLLSRMLVIEPEKRIDVEKALAHPFLAKYHDNHYEPNCLKTFDFAFEQELSNIHSDDQKRVKIQDLLKKEVLSYRKPKPVDFGALITPKPNESTSQTGSSKGDDPYADLSAFLAQLASPDKETSNTSTLPANPLLAAKLQQPTNLLLDAQKPKVVKNSLVESQVSNPLLKGAQSNPLLNAQPKDSVVRNNPLLAQAHILPFQKSSTNPLLAGAAKPATNPLLASAGSSMPIKTETKSERPNESSTCANPVQTTSESDQSNDTELFTSFMKSHTKEEKEVSDTLTVNTQVKAGTDDIEMISAKLEQTDLGKNKEEPDNKTLDAKSLLRNRLLNKNKSNAGNEKGPQEKAPGKATVTAYQRQKEREEKRRQRRRKEKEKKLKSKNESDGPLITTEDQKMLDRWNAMIKPQPIQPKPSTVTNTIVSTGGNNVIVVYPAAPSHTYITSNIPSTSTTGNTTILNGPRAPVHRAVPSTILPIPSLTQVAQVSHNSQISHNQQASHNPHVSHNPPISHDRQVSQDPRASQNSRISQSSRMSHDPHTHESVNALPSVGAFSNPNAFNQGSSSRPIQSFSDIAAMHGHGEQYSDQEQETSLYDFNQYEAHPMYSTTNADGPHVSREPPSYRSDQFVNWGNNMSVNTTLDIAKLAEHKHDEGLPPMLVSTPKGTGGGYGVGYDMESMMAYHADLQNVNMDSAPLSASLLADWMDVTANMDPKALEDIQHELELSSALHDFPFNY